MSNDFKMTHYESFFVQTLPHELIDFFSSRNQPEWKNREILAPDWPIFFFDDTYAIIQTAQLTFEKGKIIIICI